MPGPPCLSTHGADSGHVHRKSLYLAEAEARPQGTQPGSLQPPHQLLTSSPDVESLPWFLLARHCESMGGGDESQGTPRQPAGTVEGSEEQTLAMWNSRQGCSHRHSGQRRDQGVEAKARGQKSPFLALGFQRDRP